MTVLSGKQIICTAGTHYDSLNLVMDIFRIHRKKLLFQVKSIGIITFRGLTKREYLVKMESK
jgi:hypothetical protein